MVTAPRTTSAPVPFAALELLGRSDAELVAAQLAPHPADQFLHAHLSALRAAAAVLQVTGRPVRRPAPRTVWDMVALVAPALAEWTAFFASGAAARSAVEAGRADAVDAVRAERTLAAAEDFQDAVRSLLDVLSDGEDWAGEGRSGRAVPSLALRAS
ncbi:MAG TPA: SAV_6107 family HEPN domain-containing protein [Actinotalea sp.]